jgi:tellurite resistance protein TehA-like permease
MVETSAANRMRNPLSVFWGQVAVIAVLGAAAVYSLLSAVELLYGLNSPTVPLDADPDRDKTFYTVVLAAMMFAGFSLLCVMFAVRKIISLRARSKRLDRSSTDR